MFVFVIAIGAAALAAIGGVIHFTMQHSPAGRVVAAHAHLEVAHAARR